MGGDITLHKFISKQHQRAKYLRQDRIPTLGKTLIEMNDYLNEKMVEKRVTYLLEMEGKVYIVENVPAQVDLETGERYFAPESVEHLQ